MKKIALAAILPLPFAGYRAAKQLTARQDSGISASKTRGFEKGVIHETTYTRNTLGIIAPVFFIRVQCLAGLGRVPGTRGTSPFAG
ncbi:MAG TPA: hypothetical protein IAC31_10125, partial [Candidatus Faecousia intestinigallinarum]|nr:hypothetical protein [Candidatus Faecousia intestinigallinarum]